MQKVQAVTGHKSVGMTEHYTHFDPMDFGEVPKVQEELLHNDELCNICAKTVQGLMKE